MHWQAPARQHSRPITSSSRLARMGFGWEPLWNLATRSSILLFQMMRNHPPIYPHSRWVDHPQPPRGTWLHHVTKLQQRFGAPYIILQPNHNQLKTGQLKQLYLNYNRISLAPSLAMQLSSDTTSAPDTPRMLPWVWVALSLTPTQQRICFQAWWSIRILGHPPLGACKCCPLCNMQHTQITAHLTTARTAAAKLAAIHNAKQDLLFERPSTPTQC